MKKRAISLFLVISMSFTFFYPNLSLNDNVFEILKKGTSENQNVENGFEEFDEKTYSKLLRASNDEKEYKLRFLEWLNEICK